MSNNCKKPNVVFILSDDQGAWTLGSYGNKEIISPTLDQLATEGAKFDNFYCTSPVCSPARASILTGKMPSQHGVVDWLGGGALDKEKFRGKQINLLKSLPYLKDTSKFDLENATEETTVGFEETTDFQNYMNFENGGIQFLKDHKSYTEFLADSGYNCGITGKWHLGDALTPQKGFELWNVVPRGATYYKLAEYVRDGDVSLESDYVTNVITDDAVDYISKQSEETPFYLSVHYTAPHDPWFKEDQEEDVWNLYEDCEFNSAPKLPKHPDQAPFVKCPKTEDERKYMMQGYYSCITSMDRGIEKIVTQLKEDGLYDNTIIVFVSDNGFSTGHHGFWGKGNGTVPLNMFETTVKVPFIISGPGVTKNLNTTALASQYDIFPTLLDMCGVHTKEAEEYLNKLPGRSLVPILENKTDTREEKNIVIYDEYGSTRMIRDDQYKLIYRYSHGPHELYDLLNDPNETQNLINEEAYSHIKSRLFLNLTGWFKEYGSGANDASLLPVDGRGQMNEISKYGTDQKVFLSF